MSAWESKGLSGNGLCSAATGCCIKNKNKTGEVNSKTGRWNHKWVIGGPTAKAVKGPTKDELQNRVPAMLLAELLQAM